MTRPSTLYELMGRSPASSSAPSAIPSDDSSPAPSAPSPSPTSTLPPPAPCPTCSNTIQWLDAYSRWHCIECEPYVSRRQARRKIFLITEFQNDEPKEKISWASMDLETSEEIKFSESRKSDSQNNFSVAKLPFYSAGASRPSTTQSPLILEAFAAKLVPPPDSGLTDEEWWKGELTERTREIDEVAAGKWKNAFAPKPPVQPAASKSPQKRSTNPPTFPGSSGSLLAH